MNHAPARLLPRLRCARVAPLICKRFALGAALLAAGCGGDSYRSPTSPPAPVPPSSSSQSTFDGWGTLVSTTASGACAEYPRNPTLDTTEWLVEIQGDNVKFVLGPQFKWIEYSGVLAGDSFTVRHREPTHDSSCPWRESTLTGRFSSDRRVFDADDISMWGSPGDELRIEWHWHATAR